MSKAVICICRTQGQAESIVAGLKSAALVCNDISVLLPDRHSEFRKPVAENPWVAGERTMIGSVFGLLAGIGILAVPGAGPFIVAGPIIAALSGAAMGAALGGIAGGLVWMGIPERAARRYEKQVRQGRILVSVDVYDQGAVRKATSVMRAADAEEIAVIQKDNGQAWPHFMTGQAQACCLPQAAGQASWQDRTRRRTLA